MQPVPVQAELLLRRLAGPGDRRTLVALAGLCEAAPPSLWRGLDDARWNGRRDCLRILDRLLAARSDPLVLDATAPLTELRQ